METLKECGLHMLREFRALLQRTPLLVSQTRLFQLLALNMFAISNSQLKGNLIHFSLRELRRYIFLFTNPFYGVVEGFLGY